MSITAMKQALEALVGYELVYGSDEKIERAITSLRQAIAEAEKQEPVAWMCSDESLLHKGYSRFSRNCEGAWNIPVYTTPQPQREWRWLTDEEIYEAFDTIIEEPQQAINFCYNIQAKLRSKNK